MDSRLKLQFWGTRGLVASPGEDTKKYGGNTPCIQIMHNDIIFLIDSGFGIANLGEQLISHKPTEIHILYTHLHWDHIQGLPFFGPIFSNDCVLHLYSPYPTKVLYHNLNILFDGSYSPFESLSSMPATINLHQIKNESCIADLNISFSTCTHLSSDQCPLETYAYKISANGESVVVMTDHEASDNLVNEKLTDFAKNCNLLIHDAQYTDEEYKNHKGFGHSSISQAINNTIKIRPNKCLLTHHAPGRTDKEIDRFDARVRKNYEHLVNVEFARENVIYTMITERKEKKAG